MVKISRLEQLIGARLDRVVLYAASISLEFIKGEGFRLVLSTACDFLVSSDENEHDYPLSPKAFAQLTMAIDGLVEEFMQTSGGNYELRIDGLTFILRDEAAMDGIFRLSGRPSGQPQWDEFF